MYMKQEKTPGAAGHPNGIEKQINVYLDGRQNIVVLILIQVKTGFLAKQKKTVARESLVYSPFLRLSRLISFLSGILFSHFRLRDGITQLCH